MNKNLNRNCFIVLACFALTWVGYASSTLAENYCYKLDPAHTLVGFLVDHLGYAKTFGQFKNVEGEKRRSLKIRVQLRMKKFLPPNSSIFVLTV